MQAFVHKDSLDSTKVGCVAMESVSCNYFVCSRLSGLNERCKTNCDWGICGLDTHTHATGSTHTQSIDAVRIELVGVHSKDSHWWVIAFEIPSCWKYV